jgi:putative DNA primase/helicase
MRVAAILSKFQQVEEQSDGGYRAACPAHSDSRPSLRIWVGDDGTVRVHCRAGCTPEDVVRSAGLEWANMFNATGAPATVPKERPRMVDAADLDMLQSYLDIAAQCLSEDAMIYAKRRFGVTHEMAAELGLGFDDGSAATESGFPHLSASYKRFPRLVVPLRGFDGVARGAQGRDISGKCPARWVSLANPSPRQRWATYGYFSGGGGFDPIIAAEGPGDGLTAASAGYDVIMIRGAALAGSPELIKEVSDGASGRLVVATGDPDTAGRRFNRALADGLRPRGLAVHSLADSERSGDLSDWYEAQPSGFAPAFHAAVRGSQTLAPAERDGVSTPVVRQPEPVESAAAALIEEIAERRGFSDVANADALLRYTAGNVRHADELGFLYYDGRVWVQGNKRVRQAAQSLGRDLERAARESGDRDQRDALEKASRGFTVTRNIDSMLRELAALPEVCITPQELDARPDLLSFANGTVELRTGTLREHRATDLLTQCLDINYVPGAAAPRWNAFLREIFPEYPELPDYMQRMAGYGITGHTSEQCFAVLWGKGANGKSVLTDTLSSVFGEITRTTAFATFEEKRNGGGIPNDIAALRGARLVMASEGEAGRVMSESTLKRSTGTDMMTARFLNKEFFEFKPRFLIMLATNHQPKFKSQDEGLWRRVKLIPFTRYFPKPERDTELPAKLLAEAEGIAAWAVAGAKAWYAEGLQEPRCIADSTAEYRQTSDALAGFFPGVLEEHEGAVLDGATAYNRYREWGEAEGLLPNELWKRPALYSALVERGAGKKKTKTGIALLGVRLAPSPHAAGPGVFDRSND